MRDLEQRSGKWVGFWIQDPVRGHMGMTLRFESGRVWGEGIDQIGPFDFSGKYDLEGLVDMKKRYMTHHIRYRGKWDGQMIFGQWNLGKWDDGEFEIWPEEEEKSIEMELQIQPEELNLRG